MKTHLQTILLPLLIILSVLFGEVNAQSIGENVQIVKITAKNANSTNYINVSLINKSDRNIIILERQKEDKTYEWVNVWPGILSPGNEPLLYSYQDKSTNTASQYRISTIEEAGVVYLGYFDVDRTNLEETNLYKNLLATGK